MEAPARHAQGDEGGLRARVNGPGTARLHVCPPWADSVAVGPFARLPRRRVIPRPPNVDVGVQDLLVPVRGAEDGIEVDRGGSALR
eukprot:1668915-Alexandrium_andersonii.AAC.1